MDIFPGVEPPNGYPFGLRILAHASDVKKADMTLKLGRFRTAIGALVDILQVLETEPLDPCRRTYGARYQVRNERCMALEQKESVALWVHVR